MPLRERVLLFVALAVLGWGFCLTLSEQYQASVGDASHDLMLDEGYVLGPVMKVYEDGYLGYRCRENSPGACYGPTQVFTDAIMLALIPNSWLESESIHPFPGTYWFHMSEIPQAAKALRLSRVLYLVLMAVLIGWIARRRGWDWGAALLFGLSMGVFSSVLGSRLGMKPDLPAGVWTIFLFLIYERAFQKSDRGQAFYWAVCLSTLSLGVRFSFLLPFVFFVGAYSLELVRRRRFRDLGMRVCAGGGVAGLTYLVMNPNLWASSREAAWFLNWFGPTGMSSDWPARVRELFTIALPNTWPLWVLGVWLVRKSLLERKLSTPQSFSVMSALFFLAVPTVWTLLNLKISWDRPHYYLSITIWSVLLWVVWVRPGSLQGLKWAAVVLGFVGAAIVGRPEFSNWTQGLDLHWREKPLTRGKFLRQREDLQEKKWLVDLALRIPVRKEDVSAENLIFFDSLSEQPFHVLRRAQERWGSLKDVMIYVACWKPDGSNVAPRDWGQIAASDCETKEEISAHLHPFENGNLADYYVIKSAEGLENTPLGSLQGSDLNPRTLVGAIDGVDYWFSPLVLYKDTALWGEFKLKDSVDQIEVALTSTCKGRGNLELQVSSLKGDPLASRKVSLDTRELACGGSRLSSLVCGLGFEDWWLKHQQLPKTVLKLERAIRSEGLRFDLSASELGSGCRVSIQSIRLGQKS